MKKTGLVLIAVSAGVLLIGATAFAQCCGGGYGSYATGFSYRSNYGSGYGPGSCCSLGSYGQQTVSGPTRSGLPPCCQTGGSYASRTTVSNPAPAQTYGQPGRVSAGPVTTYRSNPIPANTAPAPVSSYSSRPLRIAQNTAPNYSRTPRAVPTSNSSLPPCCQTPQQARKLW